MGKTASGPASPTPMMLGLLKIPPSLYQSMDRWGTLGGFRLKLPLILKWGSLMSGSFSFSPAKKPLMASTTRFTVSVAFSIGVVMAVLMAFQTVVAVVLMPLNTVVTLLFTPSKTPVTLAFAPSAAPVMVVLMPFQTLVTKPFTALKMLVTLVLIPSTAPPTTVLMAVHTVDATPLMALNTVETTLAMVVTTALTLL